MTSSKFLALNKLLKHESNNNCGISSDIICYNKVQYIEKWNENAQQTKIFAKSNHLPMSFTFGFINKNNFIGYIHLTSQVLPHRKYLNLHFLFFARFSQIQICSGTVKNIVLHFLFHTEHSFTKCCLEIVHTIGPRFDAI